MEAFDQEFQSAIQRGEELRQSRLVVSFSSGVIIMVPVHLMRALAGADPEVLSEVEMAPLGLALHWSSLDADVYVPSLMKGVLGTKRWMAAQLGTAGVEAIHSGA